ncbi:unnamed protein product [Cylicostephanus goldi]|uniref:Uncharacterized protein n=1 Tax=Cylicostephanus goldi TaxID=71465 RepID=A0A3P7MZG6_CYLGO|nr:unnamed protein product [Cylicostephanus goldi]
MSTGHFTSYRTIHPFVHLTVMMLSKVKPLFPGKTHNIWTFPALTSKERQYAHHMSKASFNGALAVFLQVSPESPGIFVTFFRLFRAESLESLKGAFILTHPRLIVLYHSSEKAKKCGFSDEEWDAFLMYVAGFYYNNGNYRGFGDSKIIPGVDMV